MIQPVVEGHGDVQAVPVLIRRLATLMGVAYVEVGRPMRFPSSLLKRRDGFTRAVLRAGLRPTCRGVLVLIDADDDCPKQWAAECKQWLPGGRSKPPVAVVLANREYEAWFLACLESLRGRRGIEQGAAPPPEPETVRGAKEFLSRQMVRGRAYAEVADQPALTAIADWATVYRRSRSFRKLVQETRRLLTACGLRPSKWPVE